MIQEYLTEVRQGIIREIQQCKKVLDVLDALRPLLLSDEIRNISVFSNAVYVHPMETLTEKSSLLRDMIKVMSQFTTLPARKLKSEHTPHMKLSWTFSPGITIYLSAFRPANCTVVEKEVLIPATEARTEKRYIWTCEDETGD